MELNQIRIYNIRHIHVKYDVNKNYFKFLSRKEWESTPIVAFVCHMD